jgi:hypothetical protein
MTSGEGRSEHMPTAPHKSSERRIVLLCIRRQRRSEHKDFSCSERFSAAGTLDGRKLETSTLTLGQIQAKADAAAGKEGPTATRHLRETRLVYFFFAPAFLALGFLGQNLPAAELARL